MVSRRRFLRSFFSSGVHSRFLGLAVMVIFLGRLTLRITRLAVMVTFLGRFMVWVS